MAELFVLLLIMHMISDFVLQDEVMCKGKYRDGMCGISLYKHAFCVFCVSAISISGIAIIGYGLENSVPNEMALGSLILMMIIGVMMCFPNLLKYNYIIFIALLIVVLGGGLIVFSLCGQGDTMALMSVFKCIIIGLMIGVIIGIPHLFIDALKGRVEKCRFNNTVIHDSGYEIFTFVADQLLHICVLFMTAVVITKWIWQVPPFVEDLGVKKLVFILMFIVCGPPANILTRRILLYRHVLKRTQDGNDTNSEEEPKTGQLIGSIERRLILFFMFINKYMAIGFLVTAKSILRFNDIKDGEDKKNGNALIKGYHTDNSEYVLVGTFISVSIAVFCGYLVFKTGDSGVVLKAYSWLVGVVY